MRPYMKRNASSRATSVTSTDSTPSSRQTWTQFAPAYAGQADAYNLLPGRMPAEVAYPLAKAAATR